MTIPLTALGIVLAVAGSLCSGLGSTLIRASSILESGRPIWKQWRRIIGLSCITFINTLLDSVAFSLLPLSTISSLSGLALAFGTWTAASGLFGFEDEMVTKQWWGVAVVVVSVSCIGVLTPEIGTVTDSDTLLGMLEAWPFAVYQAVWLCVLIFSYVVVYGKLAKRTSLVTTVVTALGGGTSSGVTMALMKTLACMTAGTAVVDGVGAAWNGLPVYDARFWRCVAQLIVVACIVLHQMSLCLASAEIGIVSPLQITTTMLSATIAGGALFQDMSSFTPTALHLFAVALVADICGICVIVYFRVPKHVQVPGDAAEAAVTAELAEAEAEGEGEA
ncbi:hypothetical protein N9S81_00400, partial [bacterium]|nr:hypothetical protein [bacterium]